MTDIHLHAFDTHKYVKELQGTGFNESQAEVIVRSLLESREYNFSKLATRYQLTMLENSMSNKLENIENSMNNRFEAIEGKLDFKIDNLRNEIKVEISNAQLTILKWMIPCFITTIGMIIGILIKLL